MWRLLILTPTRALLSLIAIWWVASSFYAVSLVFDLDGTGHRVGSEPDGWTYSQNRDGFSGKVGFWSAPIAGDSLGLTAALSALAKQYPELQHPTSPRYIQLNPGFLTFRSPAEYIICIRHWLIFSAFAILQFGIERKFYTFSPPSNSLTEDA